MFSGDFDGDGALDLVTANENSNNISVLVNATVTGAEDPGVSTAPTRYALHRSAPNPFEPMTTIRFDLPATAHVKLKIFDVSGQCVQTLVDADMVPGRYSMTWDGRDTSGRTVAHGIYFARLTAGSFTAAQKLVRLR